MSPEGDIIIGEGGRDGDDGIWKFIGGTGKWKGITGFLFCLETFYLRKPKFRCYYPGAFGLFQFFNIDSQITPKL